ncbi:DUF5753 domain-containing protein [Streptomyces sp. PG2]
MASIIPRHPFPTGNAEAGLAVLQENAQQLIDGLEEGSTNPGDALSTTLTLAEAHCLMDPRAAIFPTWDAWVDAMQIGSALFACRVPQPPPSEVELRVEHRMRRRVIIERPSPVPYDVLVHEAALRIRVGGRAASRAQLARVLELSETDHVTVRVIPFSLDDFADVTAGMVYVGAAVPRLDTVVRDGPHGSLFIDSEAQLGVFRTLFRRVKSVSLAADRSRDLIHSLTKDL